MEVKYISDFDLWFVIDKDFFKSFSSKREAEEYKKEREKLSEVRR